jgi:ankyrin repeat protein
MWWLAVICRGTTALHFAAAAKNNALAVCQLLLLNGADPYQAGEHRGHEATAATL